MTKSSEPADLQRNQLSAQCTLFEHLGNFVARVPFASHDDVYHVKVRIFPSLTFYSHSYERTRAHDHAYSRVHLLFFTFEISLSVHLPVIRHLSTAWKVGVSRIRSVDVVIVQVKHANEISRHKSCISHLLTGNTRTKQILQRYIEL